MSKPERFSFFECTKCKCEVSATGPPIRDEAGNPVCALCYFNIDTDEDPPEKEG